MSDTLRSLFSGSGKDENHRSTRHQQVIPEVIPSANIVVVGLGGGGSNAVQHMVERKIQGVEFIAVNTDAQALYHNPAPRKINIGRGITRGLGAGSNPEIGKKAAEESSEEIKAALEGVDMVFLTAGLGGGTGSGGIPIFAEIARGLGILTVGVVTRPFGFEGIRRKRQADEALEQLKSKVDTLITIPNDKILALIDKTTPLMEAFKVVDEVLQHAIEGIASLITVHGLVNVDFADVKMVMQDAGSALMGIGYGTGDSRAAEAARAAVHSPLLDVNISGAKGILFNITGGTDLSMFEVDEAARIITESADADANIIFGAVIDEASTGEVKCTVIATGFESQELSPSLPGATTVFQGKEVKRIGFVPGMLRGSAEEKEGYKAQPVSVMKERAPVMTEEELEVPAFMRRKISK